MKLLAIMCCLSFLLASCIEYRWNRDGQERYLSLIHLDRQNLDTKLGSKAKLWVVPTGDARIYLGVDFRDHQYLTGSLGLMLYPSEGTSIEIGVRTLLLSNDVVKDYDDSRDTNLWEDAPRFIFIGGLMRF